MLPTTMDGYPKKSTEFSIQIPTQFSKRPRNLYRVEIGEIHELQEDAQ
jgi:hypothetical protein